MPGPSRTRFALLFGLLTAPVLAADSGPPAAKKVTLREGSLTPAKAARAIRTATAIEVDVSALDANKTFALDLRNADFWTAVGQLADRTDSKVVATGGRVALKPGKSLAAVSVTGPFRFVEREVYARTDPETGKPTYEITLEVCWEPWVLAYRIDSTPSVVTARSDRGVELPVARDGSRALTSGNVATLIVRPAATRADKTVTLTGSVRVTVADTLLRFEFDATNPQAAPAKEGVIVEVKKHGKDGADWYAQLDVRRPKTDVVIESNEYALFQHNAARLVPPQGNPIVADQVEPVDLRYGFKGLADRIKPGWKFEYTTPGPLREILVPFELKDIRLP